MTHRFSLGLLAVLMLLCAVRTGAGICAEGGAGRDGYDWT